jgi:hypothetical protein
MSQPQQEQITKHQKSSGGGTSSGPPQIDAGSKNYVPFTLTFADAGGNQATGYVIATSTDPYRDQDNGHAYTIDLSAEYYNISSMLSALASATTGSSLAFSTSGSQFYPGSGPIPNFSAIYAAEATQPVTSLTWTQTEKPSAALSDGVSIAMSFAHLSYANNAYSGWIDWWYLGQSAPTSSLIPSTVTTTLSYGTAPNSANGNVWFHASASVTTKHLW